MLRALQATEQQCLAHNVQVRAQRVHQTDAILLRISRQVAIISRTSQGIIHDLVETATTKLLRDQVLHLIAVVRRGLIAQASFHLLVELHVVIAIDTENILDNVNITLYVYTINRHTKAQSLSRLRLNLHLQAVDDALNRLYRDLLTDQAIDLRVRDLHTVRLNNLRINILDSAGNLTARQLLDQESRPFQDIDRIIRIQATLEAERGVRVQAKTTGRLTDPCRMEASRFQEDIGSLLGYARIQATENTTDTHRLFRITDHQVAIGQRTLYAIQRNELRTRLNGLDNHLISLNLSGIERMQGLSQLMQDEIGDIDHVINRTQANHTQPVLQPFRALLNRHALDRHARVTQASLFVLDNHLNGRCLIVDLEGLNRRQPQCRRLAGLLQISGQVASDTIMRRRVHPVRSDIHLQDIITLYIIIIFRQCTDNRVSRQYDNTGMIGSDTDLILGANHAIRLNPADLRLLDRETLVAIIQFRPVNSDNHLLACRHVRSATNNLQWRLATHIHRRDM